MLLSIVFILHPQRDYLLPPTLGNAVHACFLELIENINSTLAEGLHSPRRDKPFTVSSLQGRFEVTKEGLLVRKGEEYWLRFTSLSEVLSQLLLGLSESVRSLRIFKKDFEVIRVAKDESGHPWARKINFDELYRKWALVEEDLPSKIRVKFFSPTTFRSSGRNTPFPLPKLVFQSLLSRWNRYACTHPSSELRDIIEDEMTLSRYELRTRMMDFGKYRQVGFVGECEFMLPKGIDRRLTRWIHLLSDFAFFSGVGYKTTMGMGQTRKMISRQVK